MTKEEIQKKAYSRMTLIEERYHDHILPEIQSYWLLNYLIAEGMRAFIGSYGLRTLHLGDCNDGRETLGLGPLSGFERDAVKFINEYCEQEEQIYENRKRTGIAAYSHVE